MLASTQDLGTYIELDGLGPKVRGCRCQTRATVPVTPGRRAAGAAVAVAVAHHLRCLACAALLWLPSRA